MIVMDKFVYFLSGFSFSWCSRRDWDCRCALLQGGESWMTDAGHCKENEKSSLHLDVFSVEEENDRGCSCLRRLYQKEKRNQRLSLMMIEAYGNSGIFDCVYDCLSVVGEG